MGGGKGKGLTQLLGNPQARWMLGDVEVQNAPTVMGDDEKTVEHTETDRRHSEKIHRRNGFPMIMKKGKPALGGLGISRSTLNPPGDRSLGNFKTQHEQLTMDARRSPSSIFGDHLEDQLPNFFRYGSSSDGLPGFGNQFPVHAEAGPVPAGHRFGRDDKECLFPSEPEPTNDDPEELIEPIEHGPRMPAFQNRELLPKGEIFKNKAPVAAKEA
jgi:hypothetical protein